ncbi:membrane protein, partial [Streptomyces sp. NRRL B-1568]
MPRWRALPEELDPQVREFAEQLRRLVERSGLGIAAVADRTGYSKTSWERYLNGRLLPPRGAVEALAEAIGADMGHLVTLWELAERAWSRSELRHDVTLEAVRVAEAKAALGEYGPPPATAERAEPPAAVAAAVTAVRGEDAGRPAVPAAPAGGSGSADVRAKAIPVRGPRSRRPGGPRRTRLLFVVGAVGALFVIAAAVLL